MCGISGIVCTLGQTVDLRDLRIMRDIQKHRGPDASGEYLSECGRVALGHRRLSIIDLSESSNQPMSNETNKIWVTFNGEIYNYLELRRCLLQLGHSLRTVSDTEVIIHAYEQWGVECVQKFVGMFAFTILDLSRQILFLARDHMGVKPLYYFWDQSLFLFASEYKAILATLHVPYSVNYRAMYDFLVFVSQPNGEDTFFHPVRRLKPGHYTILDLTGWTKPKQLRYWNPIDSMTGGKYNYSNPVQTFQDLLGESIGLQLRSDVPIGTCLSGGLDSSGIVALASSSVHQPMRTFSVLYHEPEFNEEKFVNILTMKFPVHSTRIYPGPEKLLDELENFIWVQEIPTIGPGPFSEYLVSQEAAKSVKVLLNGQGPDELLGGYDHCFESYFRTVLRDKSLHPNYALIRNLLRDLFSVSARTNKSVMYYLLIAILPSPDKCMAFLKRFIRGRSLAKDFATQGKRDREEYCTIADERTELDKYLFNLVVGDGLSALLHYADRNSMAFSVEARVPYLDHRLVEYCLGLKYNWKIRGSVTKYLLRKSMEGILPQEIVWRSDKKGFPTPIGVWLQKNEEFVRDVLGSDSIKRRNILQPELVEANLQAHMTGNADHSWEIWRWLNLELWLKTFFDNRVVRM